MCLNNTAQKIKFSIKDFFSKCDQIHRSHLLKKSLMENFIFWAVQGVIISKLSLWITLILIRWIITLQGQSDIVGHYPANIYLLIYINLLFKLKKFDESCSLSKQLEY